MAPSIFISHAGADIAAARQVADALAADGIVSRLDRAEVHGGDSFIGFMEDALSTSDFCLLLWSTHAAASPWVRAEWEAAFHRTVQEQRAFLVAGRLEDIALPALLAPRIRADLFPALRPGLGSIVDGWRADRRLALQGGRPVADVPVAAAAPPVAAVAGPDTVYVTSDLFGITLPWPLDRDDAAGALLDAVVARFALPSALAHQGLFGVRVGYRLRHGQRPLDAGLSLSAQQVPDRALLWIETTLTPFAAVAPVSGEPAPVAYRTSPSSGAPQDARAAAVHEAGLQLRRLVVQRGLGAPKPRPRPA